MKMLLKKNWFILALAGVPLITMIDGTNLLTSPGIWLKTHNGPNYVIAFIFLLSGLGLDTRHIRDGLADVRGTLLTFLLIFVIAPLLALIISFLPLETGLILGLFLVAVMPPTFSSGVVMTGKAGGNMAHALFITIVANSLAVLTIPFTLGLLVKFIGNTQVIKIDQLAIIIKITTLVLLPLATGIILRYRLGEKFRPFLPLTTVCSQLGVLSIVWMAICAGKETIISALDSLLMVSLTVFSFHFIMLFIAISLTRLIKTPKKCSPSIVFMGTQKTLPLSVILQVSLFPEFGIALVVCSVHHIIHLIMDAYLIQYLRVKGR